MLERPGYTVHPCCDSVAGKKAGVLIRVSLYKLKNSAVCPGVGVRRNFCAEMELGMGIGIMLKKFPGGSESDSHHQGGGCGVHVPAAGGFSGCQFIPGTVSQKISFNPAKKRSA